MPHPHPHPSPSDTSMRDLLASCVAAAAVSTPPKWPAATPVATRPAAQALTEVRATDARAA
ncbi:hypothetical protein [Streptomyces sp. NBC_01317]|uniref:hypothetical protein n=1 Tax=Streptomyces sp. NBC_01317 TaxID=2903822 RepID=UPI003FA3A736